MPGKVGGFFGAHTIMLSLDLLPRRDIPAFLFLLYQTPRVPYSTLSLPLG